MSSALQCTLNGHAQTIPGLPDQPTLADLVSVLGLQADRIAVERNGEIAPRTLWQQTRVVDGDRIEIVHFVGGGLK